LFSSGLLLLVLLTDHLVELLLLPQSLAFFALSTLGSLPKLLLDPFAALLGVSSSTLLSSCLLLNASRATSCEPMRLEVTGVEHHPPRLGGEVDVRDVASLTMHHWDLEVGLRAILRTYILSKRHFALGDRLFAPTLTLQPAPNVARSMDSAGRTNQHLNSRNPQEHTVVPLTVELAGTAAGAGLSPQDPLAERCNWCP